MDDEQYRDDQDQQDSSQESSSSQRPSINQLRRTLQNRQLGRISPFRLPGLSKLGGKSGSSGLGSTIRTGAQAARVLSFFATPPGIVTLILLLILVIIILFFLVFDLSSKDVSVTLTKTGPEEVKNGENINYTLNVKYTGSPREIVVTDKIPPDTEFVAASGAGNPIYDPATRTVTWRIPISGGGMGTGSASGDIVTLLPSTIPSDPPGVNITKENILSHFRSNPDLITQYKDASSETGIPWQVFAGMHWREGDALPNYSLTSGRPIGEFEPDRNAAGDCTGPVGAVDGKADINCTYASAVDDIMFAADHLIGKIGKVPSSYEEIVKAFSRYNGTGNENCGRSPYPHCPPAFESEDSAYTLNFFDEKHGTMYAIYCSDGSQCPYGTRDQRPGALTVTKWVAEGLN